MNFFINNLLLLSTLFVFNSTNSFGRCHLEKKETSNCNKCHHDNENEESKSEEHTADSCAMPCCHVALTELQQIKYQAITPNIIQVNMPAYKQKSTRGYSNQLFRPPIS